jgi:3-hydroxyacyl-[acyl-carrier-protein] dehydratase
MLRNDFYTIVNTINGEGSMIIGIKLNHDHYIYRAHFPGNPITPGVCLIQIALELFENSFDRKFRLIEAKNIKYLKVINPIENPEIEYNIKYTYSSDLIQADISIVAGETLFTKITATYKGQ